MNKYMVPNLILLIFLIGLVGCKPEPVCHNITINNTIIEYKDKITIKEVFVDVPGNCTNETVFVSSSNNTCDVSLIKQIQNLESIINKWALMDVNITEINTTNSTVNET